MKILVTGGAGYVGGFCARALAAAGHEVVVLDDLSEGHPEAAPAGSLVEGDVADREAVGRLLRDRRLEAVLHFAARCYVGESVLDPRRYWRGNVAATLALLEAVIDAGVQRFVFSSTCALHGETNGEPLTEDSPVAPESPYAFTEHAIERMIGDFSRAYGLHAAVLRYFNAAGASPDGAHGEDHEPETHLIPLVLRTLLGRSGPIQVFGHDYDTPDGTCVRDYVHVLDLAQAHEQALAALPGPDEAGAPGGPGTLQLYNLGTGTGHSVLEVIRAAERITGEKVRYELGDRRPGDTARLVASPARARAELGWSPRHDLDAILESAWTWHRTHPNGYRR